MKRTVVVIFLFAFIVMAAISCRKGEFGDEHYMAGVVITSSQLSTTGLDVRFDGAAVGDNLLAGSNIQKMYDLSGAAVGLGLKSSIKIYKTGTNLLVADTNVFIKKNERFALKVIYNEELGLSGFLTQSDVPADSVRVRFVFHDHTAARKFSTLEWHFYQLIPDFPYYDVNDNVNESFRLAENQSSIDFYLPLYKKDNSTTTHLFVRLKDPVSGNDLYWWPDLDVFEPGMDAIDWTGGSYQFYSFNLVDNPDGGEGFYALEYSHITL